jgi:FtsP/CotA-like multicopper oxidase with cupredoxin domain
MEGGGKSESSSPHGQEIKEQTVRRSSRKRLLIIILLSAILFIIIALGLGLGLGLGLKRNGSNFSPSNGTSLPSSPVAYNPPIGNESWRRNTSEYLLDTTTWDINAPPTTRQYNFTISEVQGYPDGEPEISQRSKLRATDLPTGVLRTLYVINGQFPGPLIRVNRGDRVLIHVTNNLSEPTSLHWHGLYQNGTNWMDGTTGITQCPIPPGRSFLYNFTVENQYGTFWYHSHTSAQYMDGLLGPFIIHAPEEARFRQSYDYDQVVLLQDYYHNISASYLPAYLASGNENTEPVPDDGLVQGTNSFNCSSLASNSGYTCYQNSSRALFNVQQNKRYRLRLINTGGFAMFQFSVDNHTLSVIEADSTMVEPLQVHQLAIAVAERYSIVLTTDQNPSNYWIRAMLDTYCFTGQNPVLDAGVKAILSYTDSEALPTDHDSVSWSADPNVLCEDLNSTLLVPAVSQQAPPADVLYSLQFAFDIGDYALDKAYINGTTWVASAVPTLNTVVPGLRSGNSTFNATGVTPSYGLSDQYIISIPEYQVVDILLTNFDDASHPFHLHGHTFWVMAASSNQYFDWDSYGSLNTSNPLRRDTVIVDSYGWVLLRFVSDNPGMWAFHCHIAWHLEAGLMMQFQTRNDLMKDWVLPDDVLGLCSA